MDVFSKPLDAFLRCVPLPDADGDFKDVKVRKKKENPPPLKEHLPQRPPIIHGIFKILIVY